jgi:hypothetical protein
LPLFEKARIEVYLPDLADKPQYANFLDVVSDEFAYTFGGSSVVRGIEGRYLARLGMIIHDQVNVVFTDTPFALGENRNKIEQYLDELRHAAMIALDEEAILVVVYPVFHSQ